MSLSPAQQALLEKWRRGGGQSQESGIPRHHGTAPLSFAEERLWFLQVMEPDAYAYNVAVVWKLAGPLDEDALRRSLAEIVRRHEVLRTTFEMRDEAPVRVVASRGSFPWPSCDLSALPAARREAELDTLLRRDARRPFDLGRGPSFRSCLYRLADERHAFALNLHHVVCDAWSLGILSGELRGLYQALRRGLPPVLPPLEIQVADFAAWQRRELSGAKLECLLDYWKGQLGDLPESLDLPFDRPRPAAQSYRGANRRFLLPPSLAGRLRHFAQERNVSLFMLLLAAFYTFLGRWTGQTDLTVGTPVAGRPRDEVEGLIGCFINTLVLRFRASEAVFPDLSLNEILDRVRAAALEALAHEELPFERLVDELHLERDVSKPPLFQILFQVVNTPPLARQMDALSFEFEEIDNDTSKLDLSLSFAEGERGIQGWCEYDSALFDASTLERLLSGFEISLRAGLDDPRLPVARLPVMSPAERHALVVEWNDTAMPLEDGPGLHDLVARQAARTPERWAVVRGEERLSYGELMAASTRLAAELRARGVGAERLVGILMERPLELPVAVLAVLQAGGAYVALDAKLPAKRLEFMIADSGLAVVLTQEHLRASVPESAAVEVLVPKIELGTAEIVSPTVHPEGLAYLIYTSGSTGRPKGVGITHASAVAFVRWAGQVFTPDELAGVLASTSLSFDLSIFELFAPLSRGGRVLLADNALHLTDLAARGEVTLLNTVPSALHELLLAEALPSSLRVINVAGEPLKKPLVERAWRSSAVERMLNLYGPSESTTYATWEPVRAGAERAPTIGRPVGNTRARAFDRRLRPAAIGVLGELGLSGAGLARGYHRRPAQTAERFVPDPFSEAPGGRLYLTGDEVRTLADGRLDFLGRRDHQVKVRGFRIELGEIEAVLESHPEVSRSVVMVRAGAGGTQRLVAWVVAGGELDLLSYLRERLPAAMVPDAVVPLESLPLNANGKIDRRSLEEPAAVASAPRAVSRRPREGLEEEIAAVWREVLGLAETAGAAALDAEESFFEVGGNSLLLVRVHTRLRERLGDSHRLTIPDLIQHPTIAALASHLSERENTAAAASEDLSQHTAKTRERKNRLSRVRDKRLALKGPRRRRP